MNALTPEAQEREKALNLFRFLYALTELRGKTVNDIGQYEEVIWFDEIPCNPGVFSLPGSEVDKTEAELWLEIKKPRLKPAPEPPIQLKNLLKPEEIADSGLYFPRLRREFPDPKSKTLLQLKECGDYPRLVELWKKYLREKWLDWAKADRPERKIQNLYSRLFYFYQKQQKLGEIYEVVLGLGLLNWQPEGKPALFRHLLTAQTGIAFNPIQGAIGVSPAGDGARPALEQECIDPQFRPERALQEELEARLGELGDNLWGEEIREWLKTYLHNLSPEAGFEDNLSHLRGKAPNPLMTLAPALILRKRSARSLLRFLGEIISQIEAGVPLPIGVRRLVSILPDESLENTPENQDIYFPLPANQEQLRIAGEISRRQGVLVQGPPGTGKSHTITNLICHLLALGKRVLVTSQTARALKVLKEKFPPEVAALCVNLLGDDQKAFKELENSVRGIIDNYNQWNREANQAEILKICRGLQEAEKRETALLQELTALRKVETEEITIGETTAKPAALGRALKAQAGVYQWIKPYKPKGAAPLSDSEALILLELLRSARIEQESEIAGFPVQPQELPQPEVFLNLAEEEQRLSGQIENTASQAGAAELQPLNTIPATDREAIATCLGEILQACRILKPQAREWAQKAALDILADRDRQWRELLSETQKHLQILEPLQTNDEIQLSGVTCLEAEKLKADAEIILNHLRSGKKLSFLGLFYPAPIKERIYLLEQVRVNGRAADNPENLEKIIIWATFRQTLDYLEKLWAPYARPPLGENRTRLAEYRDFLEPLSQALDIYPKISQVKSLVNHLPNFLPPDWSDLTALNRLKDFLEAEKLNDRLKEIQEKFLSLTLPLEKYLKLNPQGNPLLSELSAALEKRNPAAYQAVYAKFQELAQILQQAQLREELAARLEKVSPLLTKDLRAGFADKQWDKPMADFTPAWSWGETDRQFEEFLTSRDGEKAGRELEEQRGKILALKKRLVALKAWDFCFSRLTEEERRYLIAWTKSVKKIGKGTGKYAGRYRKEARENMDKCRSAIPAWIMPLYRVAETLKPGCDLFDVVIIDEASQSGPEALFLQYLGKQIIIVGDDKQISPDFIGVNREQVEALNVNFLKGIPNRDAIGSLESSFFDLGEILYPGRIPLREHFRCMPEIIRFCNDLCYRNEPLIPLRQFGQNRLTPVVKTVYCPQGFQKGESPKVTNPPEAQALAQAVTECCADPLYRDKTMGVISLLGEEQARLIEKLLLEKLTASELEKRQLICGDAYAFQGDERDVMFLSLVSSPGPETRVATLTRAKDERRFNVAISRAKDQLQLFHSAQLEDLNPNCLRYRLLQYCLNPGIPQAEFDEKAWQTISLMRQNADPQSDPPPSPFAGWLEVEVYLQVAGLGYRVYPKFAISELLIDLVVEGENRKMGLECQGETWEGEKNYQVELLQQKMLERCGWTFQRLRGSEFYRNPQAVIQRLVETLEKLSIKPAASL